MKEGLMGAKCFMIQGTASHVGKSILTAAFCAYFRREGIRVAPFKPQNMSLNSFVTPEGGEIGIAQAFQAWAAGTEPAVHMNPVLLKPLSDKRCEVIIQGKVYDYMTAREYAQFKKEIMKYVMESYNFLAERYDLIVVEGAGSPAEINLLENDIANMGFARMVDAPVLLVGDIDRGGVFASIVGTIELLPGEDRKRIRGIIINKFRGDMEILKPGIGFLEKRISVPVIGVIPYVENISLYDEDSVSLQEDSKKETYKKDTINIAVILLPHISNFTDFKPLEMEKDVHLRYIRPGESIGMADLVIIPGSRNTLEDLEYIRREGLDGEILDHVKNGGWLMGICGGYQMLGTNIHDPHGMEKQGMIKGLGYLPVETVMERKKITYQVEFTILSPLFSPLKGKGYEIHMGRSKYTQGCMPLLRITSRNNMQVDIPDGVVSGKVFGTYIHGLFENDPFRRELINIIKLEKGLHENKNINKYNDIKAQIYNNLSDIIAQHIDLKSFYSLMNILPVKERGQV